MVDSKYGDQDEPGDTGPYDFCRMLGGGGGGGHLEIHADIHNTDFCYVIECYINY